MLQLKTKQEGMLLQPIPIQRGIFQGTVVSIAVTFLYSAYSINRADCGYQVHGTERKINHLYMDYMKLLGRYGDDFENKIKIEEGISKDINMNFGLGKCAEMCLKQGSVQTKTYIGNAFEKDIKERDLRKAYKCLRIEDSHDIE